MAKMIPDLIPETIENNGERYFYSIASQLPEHYTVFYSYKYSIDDNRNDPYGLREADFVIVHPSYGFVVVEVKSGEIQYLNGVWQEVKNGQYKALSKDPIKQARDAMFAILNRYKQTSGQKDYPLRFRYALCFPDATRKSGFMPEDLHENSCWTSTDLENLEGSIKGLFSKIDDRTPIEATNQLIKKVLSPSFRLFSSLDDQFDSLQQQSEIILTDEQERILEETEEDHRKIFFGAAGTGKTFIAMKKAQILANEGKKVLLSCYNKHLVKLFELHCPHVNIVKKNFHDCLYTTLEEHGYDLVEPEDLNDFYNEQLPNLMFDLFDLKEENEKFDAIIIDEGQDFKENWYLCLEQMLKKEGLFYIFADRHQNLFGNGLDTLKDFRMSKHKLTINLRNTEKINEWSKPFIGKSKLRFRLSGGQPVEYFSWENPEQEKKMLEKEINKLISGGLSPRRIIILSPNKKEKSCLKGKDRIGSWPLIDLSQGDAHGIRFSTIRAFKGLESDVVLIIGIKSNSYVCSAADLYVGGTRARFLLKIYHQKDWSLEDLSFK